MARSTSKRCVTQRITWIAYVAIGFYITLVCGQLGPIPDPPYDPFPNCVPLNENSTLAPMCDGSNTTPGISWCYYQNQLRFPYVFNYTIDIAFLKNYTCPSDDLWSECSLISRVELNEITDPKTNYTYRLAMIITTNNGIMFFDLNSEGIFYMTDNANDTITQLESFKYNATVMYVFIGSLKNKAVLVLPQYAPFPSPGESYIPTYDNSTVGLQAAYSGQNPSDLIVAVYLNDTSTSTYAIAFSRLNSALQNQANFATWTIDRNPATANNGPLGFQLISQSYNFTIIDYNQTSYQSRLLVMIYDQKFVSIFEFDEAATNRIIPFGYQNSSMTSLFYVAPDDGTIIVSASMWAENQTRTYINNQTGFLEYYPSQLVWLTLGLQFPNGTSDFGYTLTLVGFPEFQWYLPSPYTGVYNPVNRTMCESLNNWFNPNNGTCTDRPTYQQLVWEIPNYIKTRFVPEVPSSALSLLQVFTNGAQISPLSSYQAVFMRGRRSIFIYGAQVVQCTQTDLQFETLNTFDYIGNITHMAIAQNALHIFAIVTRNKWELDSMTRFNDICNVLQNGTDQQKQFLQPFADQCANFHRSPDINDFIQHVSMCPMGLYCPSLSAMQYDVLPNGMYTTNSFQAHTCEPGNFCMQGIKRECPKGFLCPFQSMSAPLVCSIAQNYDYTCFGDGLTSPLPCPDGMSCPSPYLPPLPAPPGTFTYETGPRTFFGNCVDGDWCMLGRSNNNTESGWQGLDCPANTYCQDPTVITPEVCYCDTDNNNCSYCPAGSVVDAPCPVGNYCQGPNSIQPCRLTQHCPAGSISPQICAPGYYCPSPSEQIICPEGYFCKLGSIEPQKCPILSYCPKGSKSEKDNFIQIFFGGIAIIVIVVAWKLIFWYRDKKRKEREDRRRQTQSSSTSSIDLSDSETDSLISNDEKQNTRIDIRRSADLTALRQSNFTIDFEFKELGLELKENKKRVLAGVTGKIQHGRVTAVMGPSGAGKTTFLSTLSGKVSQGTILGDVYINGEKSDIKKYKKIVGFVPQEDIMLTMLSVKEILTMSAEVRLPQSMSKAEKQSIVNTVISVLGLHDIRHSAIGDATKRGISGGQRKRVNIGMELVASPTVLFLDEPTSGLDSSSSQEVCEALRKVSRLGLTIVTVIHQPRYEIFTMFDDVLLLGKGGRTVYLGPTKLAINYFEDLGFRCPEHSNPADFFLDVISGAVPRHGHPDFVPSDLFELWEKNKDNKKYANESHQVEGMDYISTEKNASMKSIRQPVGYTERKTAGFLKQLWLFFFRAILQQTRDVSSLALDAILVCLAGIFLGIVFYNAQYIGPPQEAVCNTIQVEQLKERCELPIDDPIGTIASLTCLSLSLTGVAAALRVFGSERVVFWRESSSGTSTLAYFLGKDLAQIPNMFIAPLLFLTLYYSLTVPRSPFIDILAVLLLVQFTSVSIGYLVSIVVQPSVAQLSGVVAVLVCMMFSGARPTLVELKTMPFPLPIMPYISYLRWAEEALYITEIGRYKDVYNINTGLSILGYDLNHYTTDMLVVLALGVSFRIIAYVCLELLHRDKRK